MKKYKIFAYTLNITAIFVFLLAIIFRYYYQYEIIKKIMPEISFWEWYWGFAK